VGSDQAHRQGTELLDDGATQGKAIKCISMLLPQLPAKHDYKIIFMMRPIDEVAQSQRSMVRRLQTQRAKLDEEQLQRGLTAHREEIRRWMTAALHVKWIEVDYPELVRNPPTIIPRLVEFVGADKFPLTSG
jgi:Sulfotransferase family